jgi:hypothetical protein
MKKLARDITVVIVLFALLLVAPVLMEEFSGPAPVAPATKIAPETPEVTATKTPPMPEPYNSGGSDQMIESARGSVEHTDSIIADSDCSFTGSRSYSTSTSGVLSGRGGDTIVFGGAEDKNSSVAGPSVDAGGGNDTIEIRGMGTLTLDGGKLKSIEVVKVRNGVPNVVVVLPRGLAGAGGRHIVIDGDTSDEAVLASCLEWRDPVPVTVDDVNYMRYDATDSAGIQASVSVSSEMRVDKR